VLSVPFSISFPSGTPMNDYMFASWSPIGPIKFSVLFFIVFSFSFPLTGLIQNTVYK
jgi:hypothetical protein